MLPSVVTDVGSLSQTSSSLTRPRVQVSPDPSSANAGTKHPALLWVITIRCL